MTPKPPVLPEPEVWMRKSTRRALERAVRSEFEGATDAELKAGAAVVMGKVAGDIVRVMVERSFAQLWAAYAEALARACADPPA
jgi:hypothetical protein